MGGIHFTMNEEELLMERERKVEESYKNYFDSRPGLEKELDELYDLYQNDKISFDEYRKRALKLGKKYD
jgi:F0F1-type ATP synthase B chain